MSEPSMQDLAARLARGEEAAFAELYDACANRLYCLQSGGPSDAPREVATGPSRDALVQAAVTVAEATDAQTGRRFARHLAVLSGWEFTHEEASVVDVAVKRAPRHADTNGNRG